MHAPKEEVDAEVGDNHTHKSHEAVDMEQSAAKETVVFQAEGDQVDEEGDECPKFLGVPRPVASPRDVGPYGAYHDAHGQQSLGGIEEQQAATHRRHAPRGEEQRHEAVEHHEEEEGVGHHDDRNMQRQQRGVEDRHEVCDRRVGTLLHGHQLAETHGQQPHGWHHPMPPHGGKHGNADDDGQEVQGVEGTRHGDMAADNPPQHKGGEAIECHYPNHNSQQTADGRQGTA